MRFVQGRWIGASLKRGIKYLIFISWGALIFIIFMIVTDVTGRFALNRPLPGSVEISQILLPFIVFPSLAYALAVGSHVRVSLITRRLPSRVRLWCEIFTDSLGFAFFALLTYIAWLHFWKSFVIRELMEAAIYLPWWPSKLILPIGTAAFCIQFLINLVVALRELRSQKTRGVTV